MFRNIAWGEDQGSLNGQREREREREKEKKV